MHIIWKNILFISPIIILVAMLYFVNYTVKYFKEVTYSFVFNANVGFVQTLEKELDGMSYRGYSDKEYSGFHNAIIHVFNNTLGERETAISFLLDNHGTVFHSNSENEEYLTELLEDEYDFINRASVEKSGQLILQHSGKDQLWYYHTVSDGIGKYRLFMSVDRDMLEAMLDTDKIAVPLTIIGLALIIAVEDSIWIRAIRRKRKDVE